VWLGNSERVELDFGTDVCGGSVLIVCGGLYFFSVVCFSFFL
jgi:hypothetical protein